MAGPPLAGVAAQHENDPPAVGPTVGAAKVNGRVTDEPRLMAVPDGAMLTPGATVSVVAVEVTHSPVTMPRPVAWPIRLSLARSVAWLVARSSAVSSRPLT